MKYRNGLPQLNNRLMLTDGGLETTLVFLEGIDLPEFAAVDQLRSVAGRQRLEKYFRDYLSLAQNHGAGFILESPTWRANPDWIEPLGYELADLASYNRMAIEMLTGLRDEFEQEEPVVISGCIGPRSDGYAPAIIMEAEEARAYHQWQVDVLAETNVDCVSAVTMAYPDEAIGIAKAAQQAGVPSVISLTVETDGRLLSGEGLGEAIEKIDSATAGAPAYYMINCAHPSHFEPALASSGEWLKRLRGVRANASRCSHAELDEAEELDWGNPQELGRDYARLATLLPNLSVVGGCCGTDLRHLRAIAGSLLH